MCVVYSLLGFCLLQMGYLPICIYYWRFKFVAISYSSEIRRGLCLNKCFSEMLQNLPYFWNMKTHVDFFNFIQLNFFPNESPGLYRLRSGPSLGEKIKLHEMKN